MTRHTARRLLSRLHLYIALSCGIAFVLLGLTGSALDWLADLDTALNPGLLHVIPAAGLKPGERAGMTPTAIDALLGRLAANPGYGRPSQLSLPEHADAPVIAWYRRAPAAAAVPFALEVSRQVMADPATLPDVGERNWGEAGLSRPLLMPTLFHLRRYLLAGDWGRTTIGVIGPPLSVTALTGIALWLPKPTLKALTGEVHLSKAASLFGSYSRIDGKTAATAGAPMDVHLGARWQGPDKAVLGANWQWAPSTHLRPQAAHVADRDFNIGRKVGTANLEEHFKGYTLVDFAASWDSAYGKLGVGIENLLDRQYMAITRNRSTTRMSALILPDAAAPSRPAGPAASDGSLKTGVRSDNRTNLAKDRRETERPCFRVRLKMSESQL